MQYVLIDTSKLPSFFYIHHKTHFRQPKLLPCHHSFCLPCLESYADSVHRNLKCPECRAEHSIPYEGVKNFQTNYTLTGFLDIHLEATEENAEQLEAYIQR